MARTAIEWAQKPDLQPGEWVDSRIYTDPEIFEEEIEKIWKKTWLPLCHESELPEPYDFRTFTVGREPVVVCRGPDGRVRAFLNVCPHRAMMIERRPVGSFRDAQPSGGPKHMTCMFHGWQFDMQGNCAYISREKEGYQDRLSRDSQGLREFRCEVAFGGFVWVNLDDTARPTVEEWVAGALDCIRKSIDAEPLEVFHYHKAIIDCNYKLWHDTNSEFYHDYMHYFNRITGFNEGYFKRKCVGFANGHVNVGTFQVQYTRYTGAQSRAPLSFPHLPPDNWFMVDLFPGVNFNLRGSVLRCDLMTPLAPNRVLIEFRTLGLRSDTPEQRQERILANQTIWGPFGRNLHEDLVGVAGQGAAMVPGSEARRVLHGRREDNTIHDEVGMRHYYEEWSRRVGRLLSDPV
jgi:methanesulfonate monooxygenase large subunit